jgi:hypothetical protein
LLGFWLLGFWLLGFWLLGFWLLAVSVYVLIPEQCRERARVL